MVVLHIVYVGVEFNIRIIEHVIRSRTHTVRLHIHNMCFCGRHRSRSDSTECALRSQTHTVRLHKKFVCVIFLSCLSDELTSQVKVSRE